MKGNERRRRRRIEKKIQRRKETEGRTETLSLMQMRRNVERQAIPNDVVDRNIDKSLLMVERNARLFSLQSILILFIYRW